jgi:hypothetical protein
MQSSSRTRRTRTAACAKPEAAVSMRPCREPTARVATIAYASTDNGFALIGVGRTDLGSRRAGGFELPAPRARSAAAGLRSHRPTMSRRRVHRGLRDAVLRWCGTCGAAAGISPFGHNLLAVALQSPGGRGGGDSFPHRHRVQTRILEPRRRCKTYVCRRRRKSLAAEAPWPPIPPAQAGKRHGPGVMRQAVDDNA